MSALTAAMPLADASKGFSLACTMPCSRFAQRHGSPGNIGSSVVDGSLA